MFYNNFKYELKLFFRSSWFFVILITSIILFSYASHNGNQNTVKRNTDIKTMLQKQQQNDSVLYTNLVKLHEGEKLDLPYWKLPSEPMTIGYRHPRLAIMKPSNLSFVSTGQSDMYTHFKSPTVYGNNFALDYSELINPVQLLFGNFDLSYIIIYILPLLIIAYTFNVLSKEKELGTLQLLGAQPISIVSWLLHKMLIRFFIFSFITLAVLLTFVLYFAEESVNIISFLALVCAYMLFWFIISCIVNVRINNSSKNAITLVGIWLILVLILPASINQLGSSLYPTPSRLKMVNEIRLIKKENEEKQDEILDSYLKSHPELVVGSNQSKVGFWHKYFASEKIMEEKTKPLLTAYDTQLAKQQALIGTFKYISPAILMQESLNNLAGTSAKHYNDYKKQVFEFSRRWRAFLVPMLFKEQKFTVSDYQKMPTFNYEHRIESNVYINFIVIFIMSSVLFLLFFVKQLLNKGKSHYVL